MIQEKGGGEGMEAAKELDMRKYFYKSTNQFKGVFFYKQRINYLNEVKFHQKIYTCTNIVKEHHREFQPNRVYSRLILYSFKIKDATNPLQIL